MTVDMSKQAEGTRKLSPWLIVVLTVLGILLIGDLNSRMANARRLERESQVLATEVSALNTEQVDLATRVAGATSEAYIAEWAHGDAKLVREGEVLVVPVAPDGTQRSFQTADDVRLETPSNFQVWWALLFGK
jgi:cell division protein FtsB